MLIHKYSSKWIKDFEDIKKEIDNGLQRLHYTVEHIGSTSVPLLDAKPIIDIDIIYYDDKEFHKIQSSLEHLGYYHNGNQGIEKREVFKRDGSSSNPVLDLITHHLYVCPIDSKALERHILTRNYLRKYNWARIKYQRMKYELAEKANQNKKTYAELKELYVNEFIDEIIYKEKHR